MTNLLVATIDSDVANLYLFNEDVAKTQDTDSKVRNHDKATEHLRRTERKKNKDEEKELKPYFEDIYTALADEDNDSIDDIVILGHGIGEAAIYKDFQNFLNKEHPEFAKKVPGVGDIDLSAASPTDIKNTGEKLVQAYYEGQNNQ